MSNCSFLIGKELQSYHIVPYFDLILLDLYLNDFLLLFSLHMSDYINTGMYRCGSYCNGREELLSVRFVTRMFFILYFEHLQLQVFHKIITSGHQRLQPLFDCLLTIVVNGKLIHCSWFCLLQVSFLCGLCWVLHLCVQSPNMFPSHCLVSPYLKSLSMVAANKLLHLLEAFSTNWFLFSSAQNHHLVFFLLEAFNNIIQYQFDGKIHCY